VGHIGGEKNRGAVGFEGVDSGELKMFEFFRIYTRESGKLQAPKA